jgi:predicted acetylornithine/succinylornithine family transaminase
MSDDFIMNTYKRTPVTFVRGEGALLFDDCGRRYIDCLAGIAVASAGHANKEVAAAIAEQASELVHVSNLYHTQPMKELAAKLHSITGGWGRVFFCNSGAEANECAIKLARKWSGGRHKVLCAEGGFHGRTLATLAATGQPEKWRGFEPLPEGFAHLPYNDLGAFERAVDEKTAAVLVEPIQGERGVIPAQIEFLRGLRKLCSERKLMLIFDEIQSGMGRTGTWWAFQGLGVRPDAFTSAKALANGLPMGACIADDAFASAFGPGDHGTTFGAGPVVCRAASATIQYIERRALLDNARARGEQLASLLEKIPQIREVRGRGLMLGAVLRDGKAGEAARAALDAGVIVNAVGDDVLRFTPPLVIDAAQISEAAHIVGGILGGTNAPR